MMIVMMSVRQWALVMLFGLFLTPTSAAASDWRFIAEGTGGVIVEVDVESIRELPAIQIRRPFPVSQIWVNLNYRFDKSVTYREKRQLQRFNCSAETNMVASDVTYNPDGRVARSSSEEDYDFKYTPVTPDTIGYAIMEYACGRLRARAL